MGNNRGKLFEREGKKTGQIVLDVLGVIKVGSIRMISNIGQTSRISSTGVMQNLIDSGYVEYSHSDLCPIAGKQVKFYKITEKGEMNAREFKDAKIDFLTMLPFQIVEGLDYTRYVATFVSNTRDKLYHVEIKSRFDVDLKSNVYDYEICDCKAFEFHQTCKHCDRLKEEVIKWENYLSQKFEKDKS
jgi:hypothetical protein